MKVEIQFRGYEPKVYSFPFDYNSPFERLGDQDATNLIEQVLTGDEDCDGWVSGQAPGEDFQARIAKDDLET